jgi:hypothetical protein
VGENFHESGGNDEIILKKKEAGKHNNQDIFEINGKSG